MMETFAAVVETGSFTAAAEQLGLSKSFVSKQVSLLEEELGTRLLYRTTRKLSLSDEGTGFYKHCQLIMAEAHNARAEVMESQQNPRGRIRLTVPQSLILSGLGKVFCKFQERYPEIELDVSVSGRVVDLIDEGIDIALRVGQLEDSTLISRRLASCTFQVVASSNYLKRHGNPTLPADLTQHTCLVYGDSKLNRSWPFQMPDGEIVSVRVQGNLVTDDGNLIIDAVLGGAGIGFGPSYMFQRHVDSGDLSVLLRDFYQPPVAVSALYPHNRNLSRRVRVLIDFLAEHLPTLLKTP